MSNAVDILLVGGAHDGVVVCQPRPVPATITYKDVIYTSVVYNLIYRVAVVGVPDVAVVDVPAIVAAIAANGWQPCWDLR